MEQIMLYDQFFQKGDAQKPYGSLEEYVSDLFYMLDGYIQIGFALKNSEADYLEALQRDIYKIEEHIESRRKKSRNRLIEIEEIFLFSEFDRFLFLLALSVEYNPIYESYYSALNYNANISCPTKGLAIFLYTAVHNLNMEEKEKLLWNINTVSCYFLNLSQSVKAQTDLLLLESGVGRYILYSSETYQFQDESLQLTKPGRNLHDIEIHEEILEPLQNLWKNRDSGHVMIQIHGAAGSGKKYIVKRFAQKADKKVLFFYADSLYEATESEGKDKISKLYANALIEDAILCFVIKKKPEDADQLRAMQDLLSEAERKNEFFIVLTEDENEPLFVKCCSFISISVPLLDADRRLEIWEAFSDQVSYEKEVDLRTIANKNLANIREIKNIIRTATLFTNEAGKTSVGNEEILKAFQLRQKGNLGHIASRIQATYTWADFIISEKLKEHLIQICNQIKYRDIVEKQWGFSEKMAYGNGISALFYGPPGTGKTMAAQIMANELGMELYRIDISRIASKYIGETEKNITELFRCAKNMNAILFFDEADALFAKRSEVKNSNDRHANSVTAHLLQALEEYEGIAVLATNFLGSIDEAFKRRIKFMVQFEYPTEELRLQLYKSILPKKAECGEYLDLAYFAEHFELSGSNIKEVLINAAFLAASEGEGIKNKHLIDAIRQNYGKYGKMLTNDDFGYLL